MDIIETMTVVEATESLRALGLKISPETLRLGLQQGVYPFGICIHSGKSPVCQIFRRLFDQWVAERIVHREGSDGET